MNMTGNCQVYIQNCRGLLLGFSTIWTSCSPQKTQQKKFKLRKSFTLSTGRVETYVPHRSSGVFVCPVGLNIIDFVSPGCVCVCVVYMCVWRGSWHTALNCKKSLLQQVWRFRKHAGLQPANFHVFWFFTHWAPRDIVFRWPKCAIVLFYAGVITSDFTYMQNLHLAPLLDFSTTLHAH